MAASAKLYREVAEVLNRFYTQDDSYVTDHIARELAGVFKSDNRRFDGDRFMIAIEGDEYQNGSLRW